MLLSVHRNSYTDPRFDDLTSAERRRLISTVLNATTRKLSQQADVKCFLLGGSILGWLRSGPSESARRALPWDDDDDVGILLEDWLRLRAHSSRAYHNVRRQLKEQHGISLTLSGMDPEDGNDRPRNATDLLDQAMALNCGVCGRAVHEASGFMVDFFYFFPGMGKKTRGAKFRGTNKGCRNEVASVPEHLPSRIGGINRVRGALGAEDARAKGGALAAVADHCEEFPDEDGDGMCDAFHLVGDWHLYGWDFVIGKADVLPLVSTVYEGVDVWVTQNPWAMALADYGNCVRYYPPAVHFFMIARPSWLLMAVLAALSTSVLFIVFERMATSKVSIRSVALVCGFALHSLHFLYLCLMEQLRSGFACLVVLLIVAGAPLVVAGNVAFRTHGAIPQNMHFLGTLALVAILATWALAPLWPILGYTACWLHEQLLMSPCAGPGETTLSGKLGQQFGYALSGNFKRL
jgi:hypothetical protein